MDNPQILAQLLQAQQPQEQGGNPLEWLKSFIKPNSVPGALGNQDAYNAYAENAMLNGEQPMNRMDFLKMMGGQNGI